VLRLAQRLDVLGSAGERVIGRVVSVGCLHVEGVQTAWGVPVTRSRVGVELFWRFQAGWRSLMVKRADSCCPTTSH
jgi:hypothetical protein